MTEQKISHALEECLILLEQGDATLEECLARYPQHAAELRPLLTMAQEVHHVSLPSPSPAATARWRQHTVDALAAQKPNRQPATSLSRRLAQVGARFQATLQRVPRPVGLAALSTVLLAIGLSLYLLMGTSTVQAATLTNVHGVVEILPAGGTEWLPFAVGQRVAPGDRVRVGQSSSATLTFPNGSTTDLESGTDVDLLQIRTHWYSHDNWDVVLRQRTGRTTSCLSCPENETYRFEVQTQIATIVARGTRFSVSIEENGVTDVAVVEGAVSVTTSNTTRWVEAGQMTSVRPEDSLVPILPIPTSTQEPEEHETPEPTANDEDDDPEGRETPTPEPAEDSDDYEEHDTSTPEPDEDNDDHEEHETPTPEPDEDDDDHEEHETPTPEPGEDDDDHEEHETPTPEPGENDDDHEEHETPTPEPGENEEH